MSKFITELIGTFFLVLTIGSCTLGTNPGVIPPIAIGAVLIALVYAGGHISGAHYNPAVTLCIWVRGKIKSHEVAPYVISQLVGAVLAALIVEVLKPGITPTTSELATLPALIAEFLFTFALCFVVLNVATSKGTSGNSFYGVAIGLTVMSGAFAVGSISGGVFNPAVAVALSILGLSSLAKIWIYLVPQLIAAVSAAIVFKHTSTVDE